MASFSVNTSTGTLSASGKSVPNTAFHEGESAIIDRSGHFLFYGSFAGVDVFKLDGSGGISPVPNSVGGHPLVESDDFTHSMAVTHLP